MLEENGPNIGYDAILQVYQVISQSPHPIPKLDNLLRQLIYKRNINPRIDQMILIFSAKVIAGSKFKIPNAHSLIQTILAQENRINEWVISFVADAIGNYPYHLEQGDRLVNMMDIQLAKIRSTDQTEEEYFGYHFLPPPRSEFIRNYLNGIEDRQVRQKERILYYAMIQKNIPESDIEFGLTYLKINGSPNKSDTCAHLISCLARYRNQLPINNSK